jgi:hypothetical protein
VTSPAVSRKPQTLAQRFKQRLLRGFVVRFHMSLILSAVVASGVLSSKLLLLGGFHSLRLRYPIAVLVAYGVFLGLIRVWLWYVSARKQAALRTGTFDVGNLLNLPGSGGGGGSGSASLSDSVSFGGGSSGGGGASDVWDEPVPAGFVDAAPAPSSGGGGGGGWGGLNLDLDLDGDGIMILILLAVLILGIVFAGGYLIYAAPEILPEAAWQFALAGALHKATKQKGDWMSAIVKSSAIPFVIVLVLATVLGYFAHHACPSAVRLLQVFHCPAV